MSAGVPRFFSRQACRTSVDAVPDGYFLPPYVGHNGWVGVHLDHGLDWEEIAAVVEDAWLTRAPKRLADSLR